MSYFAKPRISQDGYDIKAGRAPDEIWRLRIPQGSSRQVALCFARGQTVRSNNPNVIKPDDISESGSKNEDVRMLTVFGRNPGFTILDCVPPGSNSPWGAVQVQVVANMSGGGSGQDTLPSVDLVDGIKLASMPSAAVASFVQAFTTAMAKQLSVDDLNRLEQKLSDDLAGFRFGYAKGCILGLIAGLTNLIKAIGELLKLNIALSPIALLARVSVGAYRFMTEEDYRKEVLNLPSQTMELARSISNLIQDVILHPDDYLILSSDVGTQLGQHAGVWMRKDFLGQSAEKIGEDLGNVAGQVLFEVILQLLLAAVTAGAGNAARAGTAAAEAAEGAKTAATITRGSKVAGLVRQLRATVMRRPGIQRFVKALKAFHADERGALRIGGGAEKVIEGTLVPKTGPIKVFRPIKPGESYVDYGKQMHEHGLKRYFELRYRDSKVIMNTKDGITGPDIEVRFSKGRAPVNFKFGELKTIRTKVSTIQKQAEFNWGYEIGEGRLLFYDRYGNMMEGVVDLPPF